MTRVVHPSASDLAETYRRYNATCNEHRFHDLAEFVAGGVRDIRPPPGGRNVGARPRPGAPR